MSIKHFQDKVIPRRVSDLMNRLHMVVFNATDGEESWDTLLEPKQREYVALGLAEYYQCEHSIEHHLSALCYLEPVSKAALSRNVSALIMLLRIDTRTIGRTEKQQWLEAWERYADRVTRECDDRSMPCLMGLAIAIAKNDESLMRFCGVEVKTLLSAQGIDVRAAIGELEAVVIFMKAAVSRNSVTAMIEDIF